MRFEEEFKELKSINEEERLLQEMARVGYLGTFEIYVHTDDSGNIPHFHIWDRASRGEEFHTCICIHKASYFHHTGKENTLNSKQRKSLIDFMNDKYKQDENKTNWRHLLELWNDNNSNVVVSLDLEMPNYLELK